MNQVQLTSVQLLPSLENKTSFTTCRGTAPAVSHCPYGHTNRSTQVGWEAWATPAIAQITHECHDSRARSNPGCFHWTLALQHTVRGDHEGPHARGEDALLVSLPETVVRLLEALQRREAALRRPRVRVAVLLLHSSRSKAATWSTDNGNRLESVMSTALCSTCCRA